MRLGIKKVETWTRSYRAPCHGSVFCCLTRVGRHDKKIIMIIVKISERTLHALFCYLSNNGADTRRELLEARKLPRSPYRPGSRFSGGGGGIFFIDPADEANLPQPSPTHAIVEGFHPNPSAVGRLPERTFNFFIRSSQSSFFPFFFSFGTATLRALLL